MPATSAAPTAHPTLILLPGLDGTGLLFEPLIAAMPPGWRSIVVAYPADRVAGYEELLAIVLDRLPRGEPFVLVAESFGGPLGIRVAAGRPAGLVGLVLCATFVTSPRPIVGPVLRWLARPSVFNLYPLYRRARAGRAPAAGSWSAAADVSRRVRPDVMAARVRMALSVDVRADLTACEGPVLYLRGSRDQVVPAANLRRLRRVRPDVAVVVLPTSHQILQRCPRESAAAIVAFAGRLGQGDT